MMGNAFKTGTLAALLLACVSAPAFAGTKQVAKFSNWVIEQSDDGTIAMTGKGLGSNKASGVKAADIRRTFSAQCDGAGAVTVSVPYEVGEGASFAPDARLIVSGDKVVERNVAVSLTGEDGTYATSDKTDVATVLNALRNGDGGWFEVSLMEKKLVLPGADGRKALKKFDELCP